MDCYRVVLPCHFVPCGSLLGLSHGQPRVSLYSTLPWITPPGPLSFLRSGSMASIQCTVAVGNPLHGCARGCNCAQHQHQPRAKNMEAIIDTSSCCCARQNVAGVPRSRSPSQACRPSPSPVTFPSLSVYSRIQSNIGRDFELFYVPCTSFMSPSNHTGLCWLE